MTPEPKARAEPETIQQIPLAQIHAFPNHPFQVRDDDLMQDTVDSIQKVGILNPVILRPDPGGGYEMISGHRRMYAADLIGMKEIPALVRNMTDDEAVIFMVDSNLQREEILPSERAKGSVGALVLCCAGICDQETPDVILTAQICDSRKVSDHHAIIPTITGAETNPASLPAGEREILRLVAHQVLMAVCEPYRYEETVATLESGEAVFTAKGKRVLNPGWKAYVKQEQEDKDLPILKEWDILTAHTAEVKEGKTTPPKHYTEDTLLSAMETAGMKDMPEDAERKGLGTPATRAAILEKLVETGFVERQKAKKVVNLIPTQVGSSLITVLPEQLQSPLLTAEWENRLKQIEHGETSADDFIGDITAMVDELVKNYEVVKGSEILFPSGREELGKCPRCGGSVTESKKGYFCERNDCRFGLWRDNKFLTGKKINLTRKMVMSLLKDGRAYVSGIFSEKTGKSYNAIYTQLLFDGGSKGEVLEQAYQQFNIQRPADFTGHSLSVSDIVAIKRGSEVSYHYCDSIGFKELEHFKSENPLKNAEMSMEDDYGMLDGIINNGSKQAESEKKPSILEKLRQPLPEKPPKTTAQNKSAEMEI